MRENSGGGDSIYDPLNTELEYWNFSWWNWLANNLARFWTWKICASNNFQRNIRANGIFEKQYYEGQSKECIFIDTWPENYESYKQVNRIRSTSTFRIQMEYTFRKVRCFHCNFHFSWQRNLPPNTALLMKKKKWKVWRKLQQIPLQFLTNEKRVKLNIAKNIIKPCKKHVKNIFVENV